MFTSALFVVAKVKFSHALKQVAMGFEGIRTTHITKKKISKEVQ